MPDVQLLRKAQAALRGGCRILQYRNKSDSLTTQSKQARELATLCQDFNAIFIVNDNVELAFNAGANGIHLGQDDQAIEVARQRLGADFIIGATCHDSLDLAKDAEKSGANYLAFGRFFRSQTKATAPPATIEILADIHTQSTLPVVAIGGITVDNAPALIASGADCVAVSYDLFHHHDVAIIEKRAAEYCRLFVNEN